MYCSELWLMSKIHVKIVFVLISNRRGYLILLEDLFSARSGIVSGYDEYNNPVIDVEMPANLKLVLWHKDNFVKSVQFQETTAGNVHLFKVKLLSDPEQKFIEGITLLELIPFKYTFDLDDLYNLGS